MKRLGSVASLALACGVLVGCAENTHDKQIGDVISLMETTTAEIKNIKKNVDSAVEDAEKNGSLNLKKAIDATVALQTQGKNVAELKRRIETVRSQLSEADRQGNAKKHAVRLADEFKNLRKARDDLRLALLTAERLEVPNARGKVDELRKKITEAEAPFEAVTR